MKTKTYLQLSLLGLVVLFTNLLRAGELVLIPVIDACAGTPFNQSFTPKFDRYQLDRWPGTMMPEERCTMQFSLDLIPAGQRIDSAVLTLTCGGGSGIPSDLAAYGYVGNGKIEAPGNFTDDSNRIAGPVDGRCTEAPLTLDITNFVQATYNGGGKYPGVTLRVAQGLRVYYSRDRGNGQSPTLTLKYSKPGEEEE